MFQCFTIALGTSPEFCILRQTFFRDVIQRQFVNLRQKKDWFEFFIFVHLVKRELTTLT